MPSIKIAAVAAAAALLAVGLAVVVRQGRAQPADIATYEPEQHAGFQET